MRNVLTAGAALLMTTSLAQAGGLDRGGNAYSILFEDGNYAQLSFSMAKPEVSGTYPSTAPFDGSSTGNMAEDYSNMGFALKYAVNDAFDLGLFVNQPYGANAAYESGLYTGLTADWDSNQIAVIAKYEVSPGISIYGGPRAITSQAEIEVPDPLIRGGFAAGVQQQVDAFIAANPMTPLPPQLAGAAALAADPNADFSYSAKTNSDMQIGYLVGAAYERPDIALRVSLTYESGVTHGFESTETLPAAGNSNTEGEFEIKMPQSITLDFQSGIAADTLAFGSIKWTEWSVWDVRPPVYADFTNGQSVTGLDNDVMTYRAGIGRRLSDELSVFGRVTYEKANGGVASRLSPTDGSISYGVGGSYTIDNIEISGGVEYAMLGDATDGSGVEFSDNTALGFGLNVGFSF